jgi:two-component system sensor histidine kinase CpxA
MRGLFFKIFIILWIAQSLIFVISTALIVRRHFEGPEQMFDVINSSLMQDGRSAVAAYEKGGCAAFGIWGVQHERTVALASGAGERLCWPQSMATPADLSHLEQREVGHPVAGQYLWTVPVTAESGKRYTYVLRRPYIPRRRSIFDDLLHFSFPQLPVAIVVGGLTTFALVLLFTRPVAQLRSAARSLAKGNLNARVHPREADSPLFKGDAFAALMRDFNHMAERLEQLVGAQKLLLRDVSHELRSPLARLSVALELAREDAGKPMRAHLDRIEREADRLNQLIGQLLTLSSMEALDRQRHFVPISLNQLVEKIVPDAEYEARQRDCTVVFRAEGECLVAGNEELLYRAIENIIRNAIRFTESGTEVEVVLRHIKENGAAKIELEVGDHGPGIPEGEREAIFRPFYRVDDARSPHTGGFGVGLAIAERAVRLHGGELSVTNREGGGATMRMRFDAVSSAA